MNRSRRELLTALAAGGALVAGCVDDGSSDDPSNGQTGETDDEPDSTSVDDLPDEGYPGTCPEYDTARVICYEAVVEGDDGEAVGVENVPAVLEPSTRSLSPDGSIEFALSNQSEVALSTNFYNWRLDKRVDGEWYHVVPLVVNQPMMSVPPGESHTWTMQVDNSGIEVGELAPRASGTDDLTLVGLGKGKYAFRARGWFEGSNHEDDIAFAATFEYEGDPLELTTTKLIGETAFEGETLVAEPAENQQANEAYVLERVEDTAGEPERVITEQLLRSPHRRDSVALASEYDANRVRLDGYTTDKYVVDPLGTFRYQGQQYELTKQGED